MRTIKFRGQRIDTKKWVYGNLFIFGKKYELILQKSIGLIDSTDILPETVGQLRHINKYGEYYDGDVYYHAGFGYETVSDLCELQASLMSGNEEDICQIIGNIHDNPELIK